jgi:hypothetical protein
MACRHVPLVLLLSLGPLSSVACATYRDDLDRARTHYRLNEYDKALVLLEVLENDLDSLNDAERAQYSYYRGMSHFRLEQQRHARHWLGNAAARHQAGGELSIDEKKRVDETLAKLNPPYWGESSPLDVPSVQKCKTDLDCVRGQFCNAGTCEKTGDGGGDRPKADKPDADKPKGKSNKGD